MIIIVVLLRGRFANRFTIHSLQDVTDMQISNHLFVLNLSGLYGSVSKPCTPGEPQNSW